MRVYNVLISKNYLIAFAIAGVFVTSCGKKSSDAAVGVNTTIRLAMVS
jgi:hypothetical protein